MPINIDDRASIQAQDHSSMLSSLEQFPDQIRDAWSKTANQNLSAHAQGIQNIIVAGMGGSALGARVILSLAKSYLRVPLEVVSDYTLPGYAGPNTLVILSSYSGTTEESLAAAKECESKNCKIAIITSGGTLQELATTHQYPHYIIDPIYNPCNQPRMATGYTITGLIGLLQSLGFLNHTHFPIEETVSYLQSKNFSLSPENQESNLAKTLARSVTDKIVYFISGEHLVGATHVINNQFNENAKHLTVELVLPELNHHYMEALPFPKATKSNISFWFIESSQYSSKLKQRVALTKEVVEKNQFQTQSILLNAGDPFIEVFELIQLGAYAGFYLALLHDIDPSPIPWVDYFKSKLNQLC